MRSWLRSWRRVLQKHKPLKRQCRRRLAVEELESRRLLAPVLSNVVATPATINEGAFTDLTGNVGSEPAGYTLVVDWGDSSPAETFTFDPNINPGSFDLTHQYLNNPAGMPSGAFTIMVTATDPPDPPGSS